VPSSMAVMPEKPCIGCPAKGSASPVSRTPSLPMTVPGASVRLRSAVVNLPEVVR